MANAGVSAWIHRHLSFSPLGPAIAFDTEMESGIPRASTDDFFR